MASSRKTRSAERVAVALSGGIDSVVLLHQLSRKQSVSAIHVHHGLSANADKWVRFCRALCKRLRVPLVVKKVKVRRAGKGLEAAARETRYRAFLESPFEVIALAHNQDDQAETVLMNLLRGAGGRGASGMSHRLRRGGKTFWRPLLDGSRSEIRNYAVDQRIDWVEDESNADEALTRNFLRHRVGPLLERKFPRWKEALARGAKQIARKEAGKEELLRKFLLAKGLRAPSEAKLVEMLRQLGSNGARTRLQHDGVAFRVYRDRIVPDASPPADFAPVRWRGEPRLAIPGLGGEIRFRKRHGKGIAFDSSGKNPFWVRMRKGGERLQPDAKRPRRTLKNLFQEAALPPWERERLPMLFCGDDLVWVPGLGIDARYQARGERSGFIPVWQRVA